jgi:hypothetical protein
MTRGFRGWAFLVARGRRSGFRTVLAPQLLIDEGLQGLLAEFTGTAESGVRLVDVDNAQVGRFSIGYVSERLMRAEVGARNADGELLTDEHGRPIEIFYGLLSRDCLLEPLDGEDLRTARAQALHSYRRFLADEESFGVDTAADFVLRTQVRARPLGEPPTVRDAHMGSATTPGEATGPRSWRRIDTRTAIVAIAIVLVVLTVVVLAVPGPGPSPSRLVSSVLAAPQLVRATDGRQHVVYEILLTNDMPTSLRVDSVEVRDGVSGSQLTSYRGADVARLTADATAAARTVAHGGHRTLFVDLRIRAGGAPPMRLVHRFGVTVRGAAGSKRVVVTGAATGVDRRAPVALSLPLTGADLLVTETPPQAGDPVQPVDGGQSPRVARRFTIEIERVRRRGLASFSGDPGSNTSYFVYGDPVVAAASGTVVAIRDGASDNTPARRGPRVEPANAAGNLVIQDLGGDRFVVYAHLEPKSLQVKPRQHVRRGQLLGRVGNSGDSLRPSLLFRVVHGYRGPSMRGDNALPFVFDRFTLEGRVTGHPGRTRRVHVALPRRRSSEMPLDDDVIAAIPAESKRSP